MAHTGNNNSIIKNETIDRETDLVTIKNTRGLVVKSSPTITPNTAKKKLVVKGKVSPPSSPVKKKLPSPTSPVKSKGVIAKAGSKSPTTTPKTSKKQIVMKKKTASNDSNRSSEKSPRPRSPKPTKTTAKSRPENLIQAKKATSLKLVTEGRSPKSVVARSKQPRRASMSAIPVPDLENCKTKSVDNATKKATVVTNTVNTVRRKQPRRASMPALTDEAAKPTKDTGTKPEALVSKSKVLNASKAPAAANTARRKQQRRASASAIPDKADKPAKDAQSKPMPLVPESSPVYKMAVSSLPTFKTMVFDKSPSWSEKKRCLDVIEEVKKLVVSLDQRLSTGPPLNESEQAFYDSVLALNEKESFLRQEIEKQAPENKPAVKKKQLSPKPAKKKKIVTQRRASMSALPDYNLGADETSYEAPDWVFKVTEEHLSRRGVFNVAPSIRESLTTTNRQA